MFIDVHEDSYVLVLTRIHALYYFLFSMASSFQELKIKNKSSEFEILFTSKKENSKEMKQDQKTTRCD